MILDAHVHLWARQHGTMDGKPVVSVGGGRSDIGGTIRQMQPPYMLDGRNPVEMLLSNMDYAGVSGCVVTQELLDGNQDDYLLYARTVGGARVKVCSLYEEKGMPLLSGFDGVKVCAARLRNPDPIAHMNVFRAIERMGLFLSIDLAEGAAQTEQLEDVIAECPNLRIAISHFGMVSRGDWQAQIRLARYPNVYIESGGMTWLFHNEFYPYPSAIRAIREAAEICGMDKLMWGSEYPRAMAAITYRMALDFVQKSEALTDTEKAAFLGGNAARFYRFDKLPVPARIANMVEE